MYLTNEEYTRMGGTMDAALYPRFEAKARMLIDRATHGRIMGEDPARESVKYCMYELIQMIHADETDSGGSVREIVGMSNDGVSITYAAAQGASGSQMSRYWNHIRTWLAVETTEDGVYLLYAGVDG